MLYKTHRLVFENVLNVEVDSSLSVWHKRIGHMSEEGLQILMKKQFILFTKGSFLHPCDNCLFEKHHIVYFNISFAIVRMSALKCL